MNRSIKKKSTNEIVYADKVYRAETDASKVATTVSVDKIAKKMYYL